MIDEVAAITILEGEDLTVSNLGAGNTLYLLGWFLTSVAEHGLSGFLREVAGLINDYQAREVVEDLEPLVSFTLS